MILTGAKSLKSLWIFGFVLAVESLVAQEPPAEIPAIEEPSGEAPAANNPNLQEGFEDPFGGETSAPGSTPPARPEDSPILQAPAEESLPEFKPIEEPIESLPAPVEEIPVPDEAPPPPRAFEFPGPGPSVDPISEEVRDRQMNESSTVKGAWSFQFGAGAAFTMNKSRNQVNIEVAGWKRVHPDWEVGLVSYLRFVGPKLFGFVAMAERYWRLSGPTENRIDWGLGGGLGWTLRAPRSSFNQGQLPLRLQTDLQFYINPSTALWINMTGETFVVRAARNRLNNLVKSGGPPIQGSGNAGVRFVF